MSEKRPTERRQRKKKKPGPELLTFLEQIAHAHPSSRLLVDLARDAALDTFRRLERKILAVETLTRKLHRTQQQAQDVQARLMKLLDELASGAVVLPRPAGRPTVPHEELLATYRELKTHDLQGLAQALQLAIGKKDVATYQRFLVEEVLHKGCWSVAEYLFRHGREPYDAARVGEALERRGDYLAGKVCQGLARKVGYQVTPELGSHLGGVIRKALHFLANLMLAEPAGRLLMPPDNSAFDPEKHEPMYGRPSHGELRVRATVFPGYVVMEAPERVVEKAVVYTEHVEGDSGVTARPV